MHPAVDRVTWVLRAAGASGEVRVLDATARTVAEAAAGHPHAVFATGYEELLRLTGGTPAEVAG